MFEVHCLYSIAQGSKPKRTKQRQQSVSHRWGCGAACCFSLAASTDATKLFNGNCTVCGKSRHVSGVPQLEILYVYTHIHTHTYTGLRISHYTTITQLQCLTLPNYSPSDGSNTVTKSYDHKPYTFPELKITLFFTF